MDVTPQKWPSAGGNNKSDLALGDNYLNGASPPAPPVLEISKLCWGTEQLFQIHPPQIIIQCWADITWINRILVYTLDQYHPYDEIGRP